MTAKTIMYQIMLENILNLNYNFKTLLLNRDDVVVWIRPL